MGTRTMEPDRFERGRAMLLAGLRREHAFEEAEPSIGRQWRDFHATPLMTTGTPAYGVMCGVSEESFEYMTAVEVDSFDGLDDAIGRMRVREQLYAIFRHDGGVETLRDAWLAIWSEWLPRSEYVSAPAPEFERYGAEAEHGVIEVWVAVTPRAEATT